MEQQRPGFIAQGALRADANEARKKEPNRSVDRSHAPQDPPPQLVPLRLRARQGWALGEGGCEWAAETHWTLNTPRVFGSSARREKTRAFLVPGIFYLCDQRKLLPENMC